MSDLVKPSSFLTAQAARELMQQVRQQRVREKLECICEAIYEECGQLHSEMVWWDDYVTISECKALAHELTILGYDVVYSEAALHPQLEISWKE